MTKQEPWFIEERAIAFASLMLTKSNSVAVRPYVGHDMAINLLVEILKNGKSTASFFGVQIVGYLDLPTIQNADERVLSHLEPGMPVCVFVIGVRKPEGLYRWVVPPAVENGRVSLPQHVLKQRDVQVEWQPLDHAGVTRLIAQVNAYYDALHAASPPKSGKRESKMEELAE